jgi:hypothetical protein
MPKRNGKDSTDYEFMIRCLQGAANAASEAEWQMLLARARSFERADVQLRRRTIAESRQLLWRLDQNDSFRRHINASQAEDAVSPCSSELSSRLSGQMTGTMVLS